MHELPQSDRDVIIQAFFRLKEGASLLYKLFLIFVAFLYLYLLNFIILVLTSAVSLVERVKKQGVARTLMNFAQANAIAQKFQEIDADFQAALQKVFFLFEHCFPDFLGPICCFSVAFRCAWQQFYA
jgi:hypothetical protein